MRKNTTFAIAVDDVGLDRPFQAVSILGVGSHNCTDEVRRKLQSHYKLMTALRPTARPTARLMRLMLRGLKDAAASQLPVPVGYIFISKSKCLALRQNP